MLMPSVFPWLLRLSSTPGSALLLPVASTHRSIYRYSTQRCGPCRGFTPDLVTTYNAVRAAGKEFEVVLIGSDRNEGDFREYHKGMPWLALPFPDRCGVTLLQVADAAN